MLIKSSVILLLGVTLLTRSASEILNENFAKVDNVLQSVLERRSSVLSEGDAQLLKEQATQFMDFVRTYPKQYETRADIEQRFETFRENLKKIDSFNRYEQGTAVYGVNEHADLTDSEFQSRFGLSNRHSSAEEYEIPDSPLFKELSYPGNTTEFRASGALRDLFESDAELDYRKLGKVLRKVQDQNYCGSCWAHAVTACVESAHAIKHGELIELAKQQLVDCDFLNDGCCGGNPVRAFIYVWLTGGIMAEEDYKQIIYEGPCKVDESKVKASITGVHSMTTKWDLVFNEWQYWRYLQDYGPFVMALNAEGLRFYKSGVINLPSVLCDKSRRSINHDLLAVGYGVEVVEGSKYPYYIVRNSWGEKWGEEGYLRIQRGTNMCGLAWRAAGTEAK